MNIADWEAGWDQLKFAITLRMVFGVIGAQFRNRRQIRADMAPQFETVGNGRAKC